MHIQAGVTFLEGKNKISSKNVDIGVISKKVENLYNLLLTDKIWSDKIIFVAKQDQVIFCLSLFGR